MILVNDNLNQKPIEPISPPLPILPVIAEQSKLPESRENRSKFNPFKGGATPVYKSIIEQVGIEDIDPDSNRGLKQLKLF